MPIKLPWYLKFTAFEVLFFLGFFLTHPAEDQDSIYGARRIIGLCLYFSAFSISIIQWGELLSKLKIFKNYKNDFLLKLILGLSLFIASGSVLGHAGLIELSAFCFVLHLGPALEAYSGFKRKENDFVIMEIQKPSLLISVFWGWLGILIFINILSALVPSFFWDPLWYHLTAPQIWFQKGIIHVPENAPVLFQCGPWEIMYLWATVLCRGAEGTGLISTLLFSQLTHALFGFTATAVAIHTIFKGRADKIWLPLIIISALGIKNFSFLQNFSSIAKNDWALVLFSFAGLHYITTGLEKKNSSRMYFGAWLLGLSFSIKFPVAYFIFAVLIFICFYSKKLGYSKNKFLKHLLIMSLFLILGLLPYTLRNIIYTGSPFFPLFESFFKTGLVPEIWAKMLPTYHGTGLVVNFMMLYYRGIDLMLAIPLIFPILFVFTGKKFLKRGKRFPNFSVPLTASILFTVLMFSFVSKGSFETRLMGPIIPMLGALCIFWLSGIKYKFKNITALYIVVFAGLIYETLPHFRDRSFHLFKTDPAEMLLQFPGSSSMSWYRRNKKPEDMLISLQETRLYTVSHLKFSRVWDNPKLEKLFNNWKIDSILIKDLLEFGATHLLHTEESLDLVYDKQVILKIVDLIKRHPDAVTFSTGLSKILDLKLLYEYQVDYERKNPPQAS